MEFSPSEKGFFKVGLPRINQLVSKVAFWVDTNGDWDSWLQISAELESTMHSLSDLEKELLYRKTSEVLGINKLKGIE